MKTTKIIVALLMVAVLGAATERTRFVSETSSIRITGTSTIHEWSMEGKTIAGAIDIAPEVAADPTRAESWNKVRRGATFGRS